ncbi:TIGR00296 family protein [Candidatus Micrarchaeota archaeon]|nr:TIGR00296 family protein [Candidatus Micrarchaeota archaeon]
MKDYELTEKDCAYIVKLAREAVKHYLKNEKKIKPDYEAYPGLMKPLGVFVTLKTEEDGDLRGCIGYPSPIMSLGDAIVDNAINAAFSDPRFPPLTESELNHVIFEVSILSPAEKINKDAKEYSKEIKIGKHGLIVKYGSVSGLLLPQVPVEYNWNVSQFLEALCQKAGLPKTMWANPTVQIFKFSAFVYGEEKPKGKIKRFKLLS